MPDDISDTICKLVTNTLKTMKQFTIILFVILIGCKNETKTETKSEVASDNNTENGIDKSVSKMWNNFTEANPEFRGEALPDADFFHNNKEDANRLAELTVNGKKKASSGLFSLYKQYNVELPKVGTKQIITDFDGTAKAIIENVSVDTGYLALRVDAPNENGGNPSSLTLTECCHTGGLISKDTSYKEGYYESRIKLPGHYKSDGTPTYHKFHPAWWEFNSQGATCKSYHSEIDFVEPDPWDYRGHIYPQGRSNVYGVKKIINISYSLGGVNLNVNQTYVFRATDEINILGGFSMPLGSELHIMPTSCQ